MVQNPTLRSAGPGAIRQSPKKKRFVEMIGLAHPGCLAVILMMPHECLNLNRPIANFLLQWPGEARQAIAVLDFWVSTSRQDLQIVTSTLAVEVPLRSGPPRTVHGAAILRPLRAQGESSGLSVGLDCSGAITGVSGQLDGPKGSLLQDTRRRRVEDGQEGQDGRGPRLNPTSRNSTSPHSPFWVATFASACPFRRGMS